MTEANAPDTTRHQDKDTVMPSEARIILGPLLKYALMGLVLAVVLVTTVVMLDHRVADIDREVATLEAELAAANKAAETADQITPSQDQARDSRPNTTHVVVAPNQTEASESQTQSSKAAIARLDESNNSVVSAPLAPEKPVARSPENKRVATTVLSSSVESAIDANVTATESDILQQVVQPQPVVMSDQNVRRVPFDQTFEAIIAERNDYMKHRDHVYLEDYKASQDKQLQFMRDRLARQQQKIRDWETYYQQRYDTRADNLKDLQERRESVLPDRI